MNTEKRVFPRARLICKISAAFADRLLVFNVHTENIGAGGMRAILEEKLNNLTEVDVELFLHYKELPIRCKGRIVWVKEVTPAGIRPRLFDTGIKFTDLSDHNKDELKKLVDAIISQGLDKENC